MGLDRDSGARVGGDVQDLRVASVGPIDETQFLNGAGLHGLPAVGCRVLRTIEVQQLLGCRSCWGPGSPVRGVDDLYFRSNRVVIVPALVRRDEGCAVWQRRGGRVIEVRSVFSETSSQDGNRSCRDCARCNQTSRDGHGPTLGAADPSPPHTSGADQPSPSCVVPSAIGHLAAP